MRYLTDTQVLPALGQYRIQILTDEQAEEWLFAEQPPVSLLSQTRLQELLMTCTSFDVQENATRSISSISGLSSLQAGDQILTCFVEADIEEHAPKWHELTWGEQMERFHTHLITCLHRYAEDDLLLTLPPVPQGYFTPPPRRVVVGEPALPGIGYFNFQIISLDLARQWLTRPFRSRMRLGKQALGLEMLTDTRVTSNFKPFEPLQRACDQALVFYPSTRHPGLIPRNMRADAMAEQFDLALITWLPETEEVLMPLP